ncbi:hypothetical protein CPB83DRAFT_814254 [Crepidotus variabilis]|uniref:Uncharacterized protein n=1 Tax=Crepidotus variabilis TaxID=179855 RepID=A0A9P6EG24_9AGAR|nr:hypothetical protein CPB83DRAFT_814254 [Crepidotus variabilis]
MVLCKPKYIVVVLTTFGVLFLLTTYRSSIQRYIILSKIAPQEPPVMVPRHQTVIRTTPTNTAGIGSVIGQLRSGAAIATMLDATFATFGLQSEHPYRVASLLGLDLLENSLNKGGKVCSIAALPSYSRVSELTENWCNDPTIDSVHAQELRSFLADCDLILDDRPWDVRQDMAKCSWRWVKHVFSKSGVQNHSKGIGIHIRWGDMAGGGIPHDEKTPQRSIPIEVAAQMLKKLRECGIEDDLSVYMEFHNTTILSGLGEAYRIVDTGDDINDLIDLASNRIMILDIGSYTAIAHQISDGGISVVPDNDEFGISWHDNGYNTALRWTDLLSNTCSELSPVLNSG